MSDALADLQALVEGLSPDERKQLDGLLAEELKQPWLPNLGPQMEAYHSHADILLYGGAAGGGKTDLLLGLALTQHHRSVLFRRAYVDLRAVEQRLLEIVKGRTGYNGQDMVYQRNGLMIEFGALEKPGAEFTWQGRPHDFIGFDEGAQLSAAKVSFVLGWLRSERKDQRCRVVIASNPPMGGEGEWMMDWFAPWLDPMYPDPAAPGELRWAYNQGGDTHWVDGPGETVLDGEHYEHMSRTFVPALLQDNPYLRDTGYRARIQNMPEPLRSQLLKGDFIAGRQDAEWQVIPTDWVNRANDRWRKAPDKRRVMITCAADVSLGGADQTVIAPLYEDAYFGALVRRKGESIKDPADIAVMMLQTQRDGADLAVDGTGGWGSGVKSQLEKNHNIECASIIFGAASMVRTRDGKLGFRNLRAQMWWRFREALDPESGDEVALPPDPRLTAELTAPRYQVRGTDIQIETKDEIKKRLGSSTDGADAVVMAWHRLQYVTRKTRRTLPQPPKLKVVGGQYAWMGR